MDAAGNALFDEGGVSKESNLPAAAGVIQTFSGSSSYTAENAERDELWQRMVDFVNEQEREFEGCDEASGENDD